MYRCSNNYWCCSPGGNVTNCCNTERVFKLPSTPAQVQNGTGFVPGYTIAALGGPIPTSAAGGTSSTGGGTPSSGAGGTTSAVGGTTSSPGASGAPLANSSTSQPATSPSTNVVIIALGAVLGVAMLLLLPITLFLLSREKKRNRNLRAGQWNGDKSPAAVRQPRQVRELCGVRDDDPGERLELEATQLRELEVKG